MSKFIDWSAIQVLTMGKPPADRPNPRLEEAVQFLKGPDFIPAERQPARVEFNGDTPRLHFRFPTPRSCEFAANNVVHGRLYRCAELWQEQPVIVLLNGGIDFPNHRFLFPLLARRCNRAGFNAVTLALPYHFQRHVRQRDGGIYFQWAEFMAQGVAEIRALTGWLLEEGCPAVALWGVSLGAWLAGLAACWDARLASLVILAPLADPDVRQVQAKGNALYKCYGRRCLVFDWNAPQNNCQNPSRRRLCLRMLRKRRKYGLNRIL